MWRKLQANDRIEVVWSLSNLARLLMQQRKLADAETKFCEALAMQRRLFGNEHPSTIQLVEELKAVLEREGKQAEAKALAEDLPPTAAEKKSELR